MSEHEKKNAVLSIIMGVFKTKKEEEYPDIVTQAEVAVSDYINKRKNEIIDKYCKKRNPFFAVAVFSLFFAALYLAYRLVL